MANYLKDFFTFRFKPGQDTGFAFGTLILFWALYFLGNFFRGNEVIIAGTRFGTEFLYYLFAGITGFLFLSVYVPVNYVTKEAGEPLEGLGITRQGLVPSLIISAVFAGIYLPGLLRQAGAAEAGSPAAHILFNLFGLWEVLFIYGWLQLRFDKAFGAIPAVLLSALAYTLYQVGTLPTELLTQTLIVGLGQALVFRLMRNIFVLWPLAWAVSHSITTLRLGAPIPWGEVIFFGVLTGIYFVTIEWVYEEAKKESKLALSPD